MRIPAREIRPGEAKCCASKQAGQCIVAESWASPSMLVRVNAQLRSLDLFQSEVGGYVYNGRGSIFSQPTAMIVSAAATYDSLSL